MSNEKKQSLKRKSNFYIKWIKGEKEFEWENPPIAKFFAKIVLTGVSAVLALNGTSILAKIVLLLP